MNAHNDFQAINVETSQGLEWTQTSHNETSTVNQISIHELDTERTYFPDFVQEVLEALFEHPNTNTFLQSTSHMDFSLDLALKVEEHPATHRLTQTMLADVTSGHEAYQAMLATEYVLKQVWDTPEEDEAWADL